MPFRGDFADPRGLDAVLSDLARSIADSAGAAAHLDDPNAALHAVLNTAIVLTAAESASVTVLSHDRPSTLASSAEVAAQADAVQYAAGIGPALHAARHNDAVDADLRSLSGPASDWPEVAERIVATTGVTYVASRPVLPTPQGRDGASLNLYSTTPIRAGTASSLIATLASAVISTIALRERNANLTIALDSAREIGAAVGIVMVTRRLPYEAGFEALRAASQSSGRKLRDIAAEVVLTGSLPIEP